MAAPISRFEARVSLDGGWTGVGSVGYGFGNGFRVEVEGDYIQNRFKKRHARGPRHRRQGARARAEIRRLP